LLGLAVVLGLVGVAISLYSPPALPPTRANVVVAEQDIETYTIISDRTRLSLKERPVEEAASAYRLVEEAIGKIATRHIGKGEVISRDAAVPIEEFRYVKDMGLEIISFPADFNKMIGGQLKSGHRINIYGYQGERGDKPPETTLIADHIWVVDVRAVSGEEAGVPTPEAEEGPLGLRGLAEERAMPASIVTVAVEPEVALAIIQALGAEGFRAWVTLSASETVALKPTPTPAPEAVLEPSITNFHMSDAPYGLPKTDFPEDTSVVYAIFDYADMRDTPVRLRVYDNEGEMFFEEISDYDGLGTESIEIRSQEDAFAPGAYLSALSLGPEFSSDTLVWWTVAAPKELPPTGSERLQTLSPCKLSPHKRPERSDTRQGDNLQPQAHKELIRKVGREFARKARGFEP